MQGTSAVSIQSGRGRFLYLIASCKITERRSADMAAAPAARSPKLDGEENRRLCVRYINQLQCPTGCRSPPTEVRNLLSLEGGSYVQKQCDVGICIKPYAKLCILHNLDLLFSAKR